MCGLAHSCEKKLAPDDTDYIPAITHYSVAEVYISAEGGQAALTFPSHLDWTVASNASWIKVDPTNGMATEDNVIVNVNVDRNSEYEE